MQSIPRRLKLLEKKLAGLPIDGDGMLVSELDGFLAGILVCPELIMPGEWLPLVWGGDEDAAPVFENARQAEQMIGLVMEHYNATANDLQSGRYAPVFEVDVRHDETLWELWIEGFDTAMQLRPDSWAEMLKDDEEARMALSGLLMLIDIAQAESKLPEPEIQDLTEKAPDLIPAWVGSLNAWRVKRHLASQLGVPPAPTFAKVGRNDPCPCGSGKKYKKCCGLN
jgi:uncharacterized protein